MKWLRLLLSIPLHLVLLALTLAAGYGVVSWLGWREYTTILSGTSVSGYPYLDVLRASAYLALYFGTVAFAPILVIAAGLSLCMEWLFLRPESDASPTEPPPPPSG